MKVVYIAGPFRAVCVGTSGLMNMWGVQKNVMEAMAMALEVWKRGHVGLCPHANAMFFQNADGCADSVWLEGDIELLRRSDAVLVTPRWQTSSGARAEVQYAEDHGIPVLYSLQDLNAFTAAVRAESNRAGVAQR